MIGIFNTGAADFTDSPIKQANSVIRFAQPIIPPAGDELSAFNPTTIIVDNKIAMIYRTQVRPGKLNQLRLAFSDDGVHFTRSGAGTVLAPSAPYDITGAEDPRVVKFGSTYYLTYVGDLSSHMQTQCLATSEDLIHWEKKGECCNPRRGARNRSRRPSLFRKKSMANTLCILLDRKFRGTLPSGWRRLTTSSTGQSWIIPSWNLGWIILIALDVSPDLPPLFSRKVFCFFTTDGTAIGDIARAGSFSPKTIQARLLNGARNR